MTITYMQAWTLSRHQPSEQNDTLLYKSAVTQPSDQEAVRPQFSLCIASRTQAPPCTLHNRQALCLS